MGSSAKHTAGVVVGLAGFVTLLAVDLPLAPAAQRLAAVTALVVAFWVAEPVPIPATALFASVLCIALGVAPAQEVLAPYGDPVISAISFQPGQLRVAPAQVRDVRNFTRRVNFRMVVEPARAADC